MTRHYTIDGVEVSMEITYCAKDHYRCAGVGALAGTGTSRSFLSQMKSFLL
jgi:hypothetical protein